uniref:non-specific serine/threonine protein kinase n=1 Tax=Heterosigma akashiwo TaxID=2829 RepID=A0A7S3V033_HETAK
MVRLVHGVAETHALEVLRDFKEAARLDRRMEDLGRRQNVWEQKLAALQREQQQGGGALSAAAGGGGGLAEGELLRLFWGICKGVEALHQHVPSWAHRDLKPDNVLLYGDGTPVLIDFGSVADANVVITNRNEALQLQDAAAQFCTVSYRAPELFDVASSATVDCRTDVWSLGCTLYAMAFGYSPFESEIGPDNQIRVVDCTFLRVIGKVSYPKYHKYSENLLELISFMLEQDPKKRPFIGDIIDKLLKMEPNLGRLSQDVINTFGSPKKTTAATVDMLDASSIV